LHIASGMSGMEGNYLLQPLQFPARKA